MSKNQKQYRVSIWASVQLEAENEQDAQDKAHDSLVNGGIAMREFEFSAEEIEGE